jgi:hypothetical protein
MIASRPSAKKEKFAASRRSSGSVGSSRDQLFSRISFALFSSHGRIKAHQARRFQRDA